MIPTSEILLALTGAVLIIVLMLMGTRLRKAETPGERQAIKAAYAPIIQVCVATGMFLLGLIFSAFTAM